MSDTEQLRAYYSAILPYYEAELQQRGDLPFWDSIARRQRSKRILELGCGTGRVTEVLVRHGQVTAVDLLIELVQRGRRRAPGARFVVADLRRFAFTSHFDLIVLANDPMSHLTCTTERSMLIARIADHLGPEGRVVLEGLCRPHSSPRRHVNNGEKEFDVEEQWTAEGSDRWRVTYRYAQGSSVVETETVLRAWTVDEVHRLTDAGLRVEQLWGDFNEQPFTSSSARMIIVAGR
jgi:SAM-dependent methyltransferase